MDVRTALRKKADRAKSKKGFTLVELVIVIAVLAIIAFIAIPTVSNVIGNANAAADNSNAQAIETAIKTAQSEVAADTTTSSTKVNSLKTAASQTLQTLLSTYGVEASNIGLGDGGSGDKLKVSGDHFYYNGTSGKVVAAASAPDLKDGKSASYIALSTTTKYTIDSNNNLTIG